ncbi:MAG: amidase [Hyphomonadaceae bacterium]
MQTTRRDLLAGASALGVSACATAPPQTMPPARSEDALGNLDATGVAARIRAGEITPAEAVEAAVARAERLQPQLNFMATPCFDLARARASARPTGLFGGVPTLIKDLLPLAGVKLMFGSRAFANNIAREQPPYVDALLAGGLIPIGKSTTPEFGYTATTEPLLTGVTRNPWNLDHSSGGSSGGSAAAVAAGVTPIADASDGGGSIRIPASNCGLFGLKASRKRSVPYTRDEDPVDIAVVGCLSHSVRDTAAWLAMTERSGDSAQYPPVGLVTGPSTRRLRIGVSIPDGYGREPHPHVRAAIESSAVLCRALGHEVREFRMALDGAAFERAFLLYWASGAAQVNARIRANAPGVAMENLVEPLSLQLEAMYAAAPAGAINDAIAHLHEVEARYASWFSEIDVLLTPVLAKPPARIGDYAPMRPETFAHIGEYVAYTPLQNTAGAPAISLPLSMSPDNLPIGSHFSAAKGQERTLLELAYELEAAQPWAGRRPPIYAG